MRIAFLSTILSYPWGGADTLWTRAAEAAQERGDVLLIAVSPLTANHPRVQRLVQRGARQILRTHVGPPRWPKRIVRRFTPRNWLPDPVISELEKFSPDLVVVSCGGTYCLSIESALVEWIVSRRARFRLILNFQPEHPILDEQGRAKIEQVFPLAERLFFVSQRNLATTRRHLLLPLPHATVIHNPLREAPGGGQRWPQREQPSLAFVGRLEPVKGADLLIHALAESLAAEYEWSLSVFGKGPEENYLRKLARLCGMEDRIIFHGYQPSLEQIWSDHHLLVSPSIDDGVPMTIPEAMMHGRPVVATKVGGAEDWIEGGTGFLAESPTLEVLAQAIKQAFDQRSRWKEMGQKAAASFAARYRPDDYIRVISKRDN